MINDVEKWFTFPDFSDNTAIVNPAFSDFIINIYHMEKKVNFDGWLQTYMEKSNSQQYRPPKCQTGFKSV